MAPTKDSDREAEEILEKASRVVVEKGLEVPVILFLEAHKPLANLIGHTFWLTLPIWAFFWGLRTVNEIAALLSSPDRIERLIRRIEDLSQEKRQRRTERKKGEKFGARPS